MRLAMTDDAALIEQLERWEEQAEELVRAFTGGDWSDSNVPAGVQNAVLRIVANMVRHAIAHRSANVVRTDQFGQTTREGERPSDNFFSDAIKDDLRMYVVATEGRRSSGVIPLTPPTTQRLRATEYDTFGDWQHLRGRYPWLHEDNRP